MNDNKLEALRAREKELRTKIATEQERLARKNKKETEKLFATVGKTLVENAAQSHQIETMVKEALQIAVIDDERTHEFLKLHGWL